LYGAVAAFGVTFVSSLLLGHPRILRFSGAIFLLFLGIRSFLAQPNDGRTTNRDGSLLRAYVSTFLLTLTNPMTLLAFAAIFAALDIDDEMASHAAEGVLVLSVFCGSALWWLLLSGGVSLLRHKLDAQALRWVRRISGVVIIVFAAAALLSLLFR
jgi:threonine/homoserine/homoserine lactone efflux protein